MISQHSQNDKREAASQPASIGTRMTRIGQIKEGIGLQTGSQPYPFVNSMPAHFLNVIKSILIHSIRVIRMLNCGPKMTGG